MENQPQNPEFRINPENFHPCLSVFSSLAIIWLRFWSCDNCIQNFCLGRYIVRYTVEKLVLRRHMSGFLKRDIRVCSTIYLPK